MNKRTCDLLVGLPFVLLVCGCAAPPWNGPGQTAGPVDVKQSVATRTAAMGGWGALKPGQANGVKSYAVANSAVDAGASRWGGREAATGSLPVHASREQAVANAARQLTGPAADTSRVATSDLDAMRRHAAFPASNASNPRHPQTANARYQAALACWQQGDVAGAKFHLDQALANNAQHRDAILLFAEWCLLQDLAEHAVPRMEQLCRTNPGDARACHTLGMLLSATGRESEALAFYQEAADLQPNDDLYQFTLNASQQDNKASLEQLAEQPGDPKLAARPSANDKPEPIEALRDDNVRQSYYGEDLESASTSIGAAKYAELNTATTAAPAAEPEPLLTNSPHREPQRLATASPATADLREGAELFQEISQIRDRAPQPLATGKNASKPRNCSVCSSHRTVSAELESQSNPEPAQNAPQPAGNNATSPLNAKQSPAPPLRLQLGAGQPTLRRTDSASQNAASQNAHPSPHAELLDQAQQAFNSGAISTGVERLQQAAEATAAAPDRESAEIEVAVEALHRGQTALAIEILEPATRREIVTARVFRTLGTAYYRTGDYSAAQETLEQALSLDNTSALSYFLLGSTLHKLGKQREAAKYLQRAAQLDPRFAETR